MPSARIAARFSSAAQAPGAALRSLAMAKAVSSARAKRASPSGVASRTREQPVDVRVHGLPRRLARSLRPIRAARRGPAACRRACSGASPLRARTPATRRRAARCAGRGRPGGPRPGTARRPRAAARERESGRRAARCPWPRGGPSRFPRGPRPARSTSAPVRGTGSDAAARDPGGLEAHARARRRGRSRARSSSASWSSSEPVRLSVRVSPGGTLRGFLSWKSSTMCRFSAEASGAGSASGGRLGVEREDREAEGEQQQHDGAGHERRQEQQPGAPAAAPGEPRPRPDQDAQAGDQDLERAREPSPRGRRARARRRRVASTSAGSATRRRGAAGRPDRATRRRRKARAARSGGPRAMLAGACGRRRAAAPVSERRSRSELDAAERARGRLEGGGPQERRPAEQASECDEPCEEQRLMLSQAACD